MYRDVSVAVSVAVPPKAAVPETLLMSSPPGLTTRLPVAFAAHVVRVAGKAGDHAAGVRARRVGRRHAGQGGDAAAVGHRRADRCAVEREAHRLARDPRVAARRSVAVSVAVPPTGAVPETLPSLVPWVTTRLPVARGRT